MAGEAAAGSSGISAWVPFFSKLVWPVLIVGMVIAFRGEAAALIKRVEEAIGEGRAVEVWDLFKIGERTSIGTLAEVKATDVGSGIDLSVDRVGGFEEVVRKGSSRLLDQLKRKLQESPGARIDVMMVTSDQRYSTKLLGNYITSLGIRFVVFQEEGRFAGWIDAGLFNSQLPSGERDRIVTYPDLRQKILGISQDSVPPDTSALEVLKAMEASRSESIAVVEGKDFKFMVSRESIIAKLLTATLFQAEEKAAAAGAQ